MFHEIIIFCLSTNFPIYLRTDQVDIVMVFPAGKITKKTVWRSVFC